MTCTILLIAALPPHNDVGKQTPVQRSTPALQLLTSLTPRTLTKSHQFLYDVWKWLPINLLKSKLWYSNMFRNASVPNEGLSSNCDWDVAKIPVYPLKLRSYWIKVDQIFTRCRRIIAAVNAHLCIAILQSILKSQSKQWRQSILMSAKGLKN